MRYSSATKGGGKKIEARSQKFRRENPARISENSSSVPLGGSA